MEYIFSRDLRLKLADGVEASKFDANRVMATIPKNVLSLFLEYGIDLKTECPGAFLKGFTLNEKELAEVRGNLKRYEELGMLDVIKANPKNIQIRTFKSTFMKRLVECVQKGQPYLNSDNTFADFLVKNEMRTHEYKAEASTVTVANGTHTNIKTTTAENIDMHSYGANEPTAAPINAHTVETVYSDRLAEMTPEDRQVYNEIVEKLNYLVLANPMDTVLATVVNNAISKSAEAILRQELKWGIEPREMIESVMFDGLETYVGLDKDRIANLVLGAFPDEERKVR